jgi:predicted nucleotidyltransferase
MNATDKQQMFDATRQAVMAALPDVWAIYVYGSIANNTERADSDLDIALLLPPGNGITNLLGLVSAISVAAERDVDIVDLRRAGNLLRKEVLAHGVPLYVAHPEQVLAWEASAMSEYAEHHARISDLLKDFKRTGIGYGA